MAMNDDGDWGSVSVTVCSDYYNDGNVKICDNAKLIDKIYMHKVTFRMNFFKHILPIYNKPYLWANGFWHEVFTSHFLFSHWQQKSKWSIFVKERDAPFICIYGLRIGKVPVSSQCEVKFALPFFYRFCCMLIFLVHIPCSIPTSIRINFICIVLFLIISYACISLFFYFPFLTFFHQKYAELVWGIIMLN